MIKLILYLCAIFCAIISVISCGGGTSGELSKNKIASLPVEVPFSDEVTIGTQIWMTKNLDVSFFRNGDSIPQAKTDDEWRKAGDEKRPAWCFYENNAENGRKYGKLYNWFAVNDYRGLAPAGWHIPSDAEWTLLTDYLGGDNVTGKKMKSTIGWIDDGNGTNESGFTGLPGGCRTFEGDFYIVGQFGYCWSSTPEDEYEVWSRSLGFDYEDLIRNKSFKQDGLSVRCIKD